MLCRNCPSRPLIPEPTTVVRVPYRSRPFSACLQTRAQDKEITLGTEKNYADGVRLSLLLRDLPFSIVSWGPFHPGVHRTARFLRRPPSMDGTGVLALEYEGIEVTQPLPGQWAFVVLTFQL